MVQQGTALNVQTWKASDRSPVRMGKDAHSVLLSRIGSAPPEAFTVSPAGMESGLKGSLPLSSASSQVVPGLIGPASATLWRSTNALVKPTADFQRESPQQANLTLLSDLPLATTRHVAGQTGASSAANHSQNRVIEQIATPFPVSPSPIQRMDAASSIASQDPATKGSNGMMTGAPSESTVSPELDELELEQIADAVYEIIENRLIVERESLGM